MFDFSENHFSKASYSTNVINLYMCSGDTISYFQSTTKNFREHSPQFKEYLFPTLSGFFIVCQPKQLNRILPQFCISDRLLATIFISCGVRFSILVRRPEVVPFETWLWLLDLYSYV